MLLLKLLCALVLCSFADAQCFSQDKLIDDVCFFISVQNATYAEAHSFCHSHFMNLAVISTQRQDIFLANYVRVQTGAMLFWIGLSRQSSSSKYQWDDGSALIWSNFDGNYLQASNFVTESTINGKWQTAYQYDVYSFVCSYNPFNASMSTAPPPSTTTQMPTTILTTTAPPSTTTQMSTSVSTTTAPLPNVTCLFMYDTQSSGDDAAAIATYQTYFNFARLIAQKLDAVTVFTGTLDHFGYGGLENHDSYTSFSLSDFLNVPFTVETGEEIDLDLKDTDASLSTSTWLPTVKDNTCLVFISAAAEADFGGTTIQNSYDSFTTVVGALVGGATTIPGLTNVVATSTLTNADAEAVVDVILNLLPVN